MKRKPLEYLVCPGCGGFLSIAVEEQIGEEIEAGHLSCRSCAKQFPIVRGIPRFVPPNNYANSFGKQWNQYAELQLDSKNGAHFSRERFYSITEWGEDSLRGKLVLDGGCGAGRFAEIALEDGAEVAAIDLSNAVDACRQNLRNHAKLHCVQASLYELPFRDGLFDYVYSIGVIQHTPNPKQAVLGLLRKVAKGGKIGLWIYERDWKSFIGTIGFKYALRPLTTRMTTAQLENFVAMLEKLAWPMVRWARPRGTLGKIIMRLLPVSCAHFQNVPLPDEKVREWVRLDTFDMYSPAYDQPQRYRTVKSWLEEAGFVVDERHPHGGISITGTRSS